MKLEEKLAKLDNLATEIDDDISLERSLEIFEQSVQIAGECMKILDDVSGKLTVLQDKVRGIVDDK